MTDIWIPERGMSLILGGGRDGYLSGSLLLRERAA
jgi:hypothetical protein